MNLKTRITEKLRNGSINVPGKNAVHVLAGSLGVNVNGVRQVLQILDQEGLLDTGSGNATATTYLALRDRPVFRPETPEGRRQGRYAVSENGRHYPGEIKPGHPCYRPPVVRLMTDEEWRARYGDLPRPNPNPQQEAVPMSTPNDSTPALPEPAASEAAPSTPAPTASKPRARVKTRKGSRRSNTKPVQEMREKIARVKELVVQLYDPEGVEVLVTNEFTTLASTQLGIPASTVKSYLGELVKERFLKFEKFAWQGPSCIVLIPQPVIPPDTRGKCEAALEVLRGFKAAGRTGYTAEVARCTGLTEKSVANGILHPLYKIGAYRLLQEGSRQKLDYVQSEPLSDEQFRMILVARRERARAKRAEEATLLEPAAEPRTEPTPAPVSASSTDASDVTELLRSLVAKAKADKTRIEQLEAENARLTDIRTRLDVQNASYAERIELMSLLLEVEQARELVPPTPKPQAVPDDLLAEALALVQS